MPTSDKEKALRLLKQYRERLTGIGDVHYLEEVAFLIHTFESPIFEKLLRNMGGAVYNPTSSKDLSTQIKLSNAHYNGKITYVQNGVLRTDKDDNSILLSSNNSNTSFSTATTSKTATRTARPIVNGMPVATVTNHSHTNTTPSSYNFYLTSNTGSQLSNTDSWGSIDLPLGDERRLLDFEDCRSGVTTSASLKKLSVGNSSAGLSPLSQVPSSNKSSSSSVSVKSVVTVSDSNRGLSSDTSLVRSSSSQDAKATRKKMEQHVTVSLHKGKEGLGFSVVGLATEHKGDLGIYIQDIQKGGLAEKSGKLFKGDQIVSINGRALAGVSHNSAIKMLQKAKGHVELKLIRTGSPAGPPPDVHPINMALDDKDQSRWRQIETIELTKEGKGFGFGIVSVKKGGVDICKIAEGSATAKDGRLKVNDHLLQINNQNTTSMSADDVMKILKGAKSSVKLVVARMVTGQVPLSGLVVNEPDADLEQFTVELEKERNGLGITIAGLKKEDSEEELRGIYISSVAPDGPAGREGHIREGDQILQVNNTSLIGLENMEAAGVLRNTDQRVRLVIGRRRHQQSPDLISSTSNHHRYTEANSKLETASTAVTDSKMFNDDSMYAKPLAAADELSIKKEWGEVVGKEYTIVVAQFAKSIPDTGLGIRVEGRVDLDDNQQPIDGGHHHIIELVREDGPVYKHGALKQGDEILEVNGISMINLEYNAAIQVIKATPHHVRIVAARKIKIGSSPLDSPNSELLSNLIFQASGTQSLKNFGETNSIEGMHTSESEDDKRMHTPEKTKSSASITLSSPLSNSASDDNRWKFELARRRAERDSWRKRHEEEKERLRIRIEKNRQDIQRQLQEKEAEFNRMQEELEREQRSLKELQQEKLAAGDYTGTDVPLSYKSYMEEFGSSPTWDHVLYNHRKQLHSVTTAQNTSSPMEEIKVSDSELGFDSDTSESDVSSQDLPSPIPPSTKWCQATTDIVLYKGSRGLGFSILDFMDRDENSVILICSIVSGGVADRNGQLKVGDKLIAINHQDVIGKPLSDVVNMLMMIERGTVIISVAHKLSTAEEERPFFGSLGGSGEFPSIREENSPEVLPSVDMLMNDCVDEIITKSLLARSCDDVQQQSDGMSKHTATASAGAVVTNTRPTLQSSSTPHLSDSHKTHKRLLDLKETVNVTSTSSLHTPLGHGSSIAIDEQLRRSMPDLLDKIPGERSKHYTDLKKVNTLPHKRSKNKIISPTPSSSFMPLGTQQSQQSPSPVRNSLSQSMNSAFSRVTPDKLSNSDSNVYRKASNEEAADEPVLEASNNISTQQVRPVITTTTTDMTTNGPKDAVTANSYQHNSIQTTPIKQPNDRRQILKPLHQPIISQPRSITIPRGNTGLGMSLACDAETDSIVVKNILSGSAVGRDGRIRIGDCIIAINHESLEGVDISQAKAILRASSLNPAGVTITYIPCPQGYVPTIATNQYLSNESCGSSSPDNIGYRDRVSEQPASRQEFVMTDQQPVRDVPHDLHNMPTGSHDPMMLPGYPNTPGSAEMPRPLQQNRMSYQSAGMGHKPLTNHPYSDSKVSYHPTNPYSSYQVVPQQSVYSAPNTPRTESFQPPPSYEVHMMNRQMSHSERQQQKAISQQSQPQQRQQHFVPAPTTASVTPGNYHMVDQSRPQQQQQPHPQQQQQMYLSTVPPSYHHSSPVRITSDMQQQSRVQAQQQFHSASYAVETHPVRLTEAQQQPALPSYPMEPHLSIADQQQQQIYYMGAQGYSGDTQPSMHYSHQLGNSPAHHEPPTLLQSAGTNTSPMPPPASSTTYQIPVTSHIATSSLDSFSPQKPPPPSYESYVRTSIHRQSRSQSPITTASMIPHQHSASDNSLGKTSSSSLFQNPLRSRDPATGVVSDAGRSPMVVRGHSAQGQYSPLLNKTDSKSRSGGDLHMGASEGGGSKVLRNTSSGALRRYSGSGFLSKPPQYQASLKHSSAAGDSSREDGGGPSVYEVELTKDVNGSLGISIWGTPEGDRKRDEPVGGVFVDTIAPQVTGKLKSGDKILEVNGKSLLQCTQQEAIDILCAAASPVKLVVQSCYSHIRMRNQGSQQRKGSSNQGASSPSPGPAGRRAAIHSWYIEEEEDPNLRKSFPNVEGHLFEVTLHRDGKKSLGMNLVPIEHSMSKGIIITVVQPGGVADSTGMVKPGDVILQVDEVIVMDLKQEEVVALLKRPNPSIHLVLMRPMAHLMGLHLQIPRGAQANADQSGQGGFPGHMIGPSPFDQTNADDGLHIHPDVTALTATKVINLTKDIVHGLGFSVMEEKVNKRLVVMVKDIVVGGPAYREGQLQIGDILLSIDGKSVVSQSYNSTLNLLKQAKTKGSATLVFAPGSLNGMSPGESPTEEASPLISPLPLTTKPSPTRDSSKQPEASADQGSSSRRSSSSELAYDTRVVRSTRKKSSKERKVKKKPDSNRQSSVDELEENMQKLQQKNKLELLVPEKDDPSISYEEFDVEVIKGSGPLGLKVVGGADTNMKDVLIKEIVPNTQADIDGQLRPGDHILKVNGEDLKCSTHLQAMQAIWNSGPRIKLCIRRKLSATNDCSFSFNESLHSPCMEVEVIELVKPEHAGLGLIIGSREDRDGVFVDEVVMNGAASKDGRIRSGDKILAINGQDVSAAKQDLVAVQLQGCKGKISLTVGHAVGMSPVKNRSPDINKYPLPLSIGPPVEVHSQQSPPGYPGYSSNSDSVDSNRTSSSSLQVTPSVSNQYNSDSYPPSYRSSSPPIRLSPQVTHASHDPPPYPSGTNIQHHMGSGDAHPFLSPESTHKEITLHRGPSGLGFTFVGGNDISFYIKDIAKDGVADKDGRLQRGDRLVAVNGISIQGASYQYVLEMLKKVQGDIKLTVVSP